VLEKEEKLREVQKENKKREKEISGTK